MHHFEPQLLLEAMIAEAGGFDDLDPMETALVGYISLAKDADARSYPLEEGDTYDFRTSTVRDRLVALLKEFEDADQGYLSRRAMAKVRFEGDYDHLARAGEWDDSAKTVVQKVGR